MEKLYQKLVVGNEKAIVAFVVAAVGSFLAKKGYSGPVVTNVVQSLVVGVVAHLGVYFTTNSAK